MPAQFNSALVKIPGHLADLETRWSESHMILLMHNYNDDNFVNIQKSSARLGRVGPQIMREC